MKHFPNEVHTAAPGLGPGDFVSPTGIDLHDCHCSYGYSSELVSKEKTKALGVKLCGELKSHTAKGYRKPIGSRANVRAGKKLGRVFTDLSGPKPIIWEASSHDLETRTATPREDISARIALEHRFEE